MPSENMIVDTKLHSINPLHISIQAKEIIASNIQNKPNEPAHFVLVLIISHFQEMKAHVRLCKCVDSPEPLLPAYTI